MGGVLGLRLRGKNLLDFEACLKAWGATYTKDGEKYTVMDIGSGYAKPIRLFETRTYATVRAVVNDVTSKNSRIELGYFGEDGAWNSTASINSGTPLITGTRMTALRLNRSSGGTFTVENVQIELGKTATEYEHYNGQTLSIPTPNGLPGIPVTSGGNYTDSTGQQWVCDEMDFDRGVYVQRVNRKYKSDIFWQGNAFTTTYTAFQAVISDAVKVSNEDKKRRCLCNILRAVSAYDRIGNIPSISVISDSRVMLMVENTRFGFTNETSNGEREKTIREWWNSFANIELLYELETPVEIPLTQADLSALHTCYPNTAVWNDTGAGMEVKYVADTKLYIDNKFAELQTILLN